MDFIFSNIIETETLLSSNDKIHINTTDVPIDAIDIFIKMTHAKYAFNIKNDELTKARQHILDIYDNNQSGESEVNNVRKELAAARAFDRYRIAAKAAWTEGNNYILYKSTYIGILFNIVRTASSALAAALNREYWLETVVSDDMEMKASLRAAVKEADRTEIEAKHRLCIAVDEPNMNKPLIEIYDNIHNCHLSLSKTIATLAISPLCIELLSDNSDYNSMFTDVFPNIVYINCLDNALNAVKATELIINYSNILQNRTQTDSSITKDFEDAKNNLIVELTNLYMYKLNTSIH